MLIFFGKFRLFFFKKCSVSNFADGWVDYGPHLGLISFGLHSMAFEFFQLKVFFDCLIFRLFVLLCFQ